MKFLSALFLVWAVLTGSAQSQTEHTQLSDEALLIRTWNETAPLSEWFAQSFRTAVPMVRLRPLLGELKTAYGEAEGVSKTSANGTFELATATHNVSIRLFRNENGQITGFEIKDVQQAGGLKDLLQKLPSFAETSSYLLTKNGEQIASHNPAAKLAAGSAFKLFVLDALAQQINQSSLDWASVLTLEKAHKSLPSGTLHTWPDGHRLTVETAAAAMISISDNTATDLLMSQISMAEIEASSGQIPFLTTRQFFQLKSSGKDASDYLSGDLDTKRTILARLDKSQKPDAASPHNGYQPGLEWYLDTISLCKVISKMQDLPLFKINPGQAEPEDWSTIAFKGGSETGVLNLTYHLTAHDGTKWCFVATWNSPEALDENAILAVSSGILKRISNKAE